MSGRSGSSRPSWRGPHRRRRPAPADWSSVPPPPWHRFSRPVTVLTLVTVGVLVLTGLVSGVTGLTGPRAVLDGGVSLVAGDDDSDDDSGSGSDDAGSSDSGSGAGGSGASSGGNDGAGDDFPGRDQIGRASAEEYVDIRDVDAAGGRGEGGEFSGGSYSIRCGLSDHKNSDNPIIAPGVRNGAQHTHDYAGNEGTNAASERDTLEEASTTCTNGDRSPIFWAPGPPAAPPAGASTATSARSSNPRRSTSPSTVTAPAGPRPCR
jgi:hypothetical protein